VVTICVKNLPQEHFVPTKWGWSTGSWGLHWMVVWKEPLMGVVWQYETNIMKRSLFLWPESDCPPSSGSASN